MMSDRNASAQSAGETAAYWFARLRSDRVSAADRRRFERWLGEDPENRAAWMASEAAWNTAGEAAADPEILAMRRQALAMRPDAWTSRWRRHAGLAAATLVVLLGLSPLLPRLEPWLRGESAGSAAEAPVYQTAVGQRSTVALPDGSTVKLNTDSRILVHYSGAKRRIVLERGQALFDVARVPGRPFVVEVDDKLVTAHGTSFDVRRSETAVQITLLEGEVTVERDAGLLGYFREPVARRLAPGDQLIAIGEQPFEIRKPDVERIVSWSEGVLIFEDEPLDYVVSEINRYSLRKIVLGAETMKDLRIGGVFEPGSVAGFTAALEKTFPLTSEIDESRNVIVLRWRDSSEPL